MAFHWTGAAIARQGRRVSMLLAFFTGLLFGVPGHAATMGQVDLHFGPPRPHYKLSIPVPPPAKVSLPRVDGDPSRPLVVIDPGHGGVDPGAINPVTGLREKDVTLKIARAIRERLLETGKVRVALTRDDDRYLVLRERFGIARRLHGDLFLSIHCDSAGSDDATGASIYTLSEVASDKEAARLAARENKADVIAGVDLDEAGDVSSILIDLTQRETMNQSAGFARLLGREAPALMPTKPDFHRMASLMVLKAPDMPSALFETGYISNPRDAAFLDSREGRSRIAESVSRAVDVFFARRLTGKAAETLAMRSGALAMARRPPSRAALAGFAAVALAFRVVAALSFARGVPDGDPAIYLALAHRLLAGDAMVVWDPYIRLAFRAMFPPAYPLLLAAWIAVAGASTASLVVLATLTDTITALLLARLGRRLGSRDAGRAAACLFLIWPSAILSAPLAQKEALCDLLIVALALAWLAAGEGRRWRTAATIGAAAGLLALTQPGEAPLAGLFGVALLPLLGWRRVLAVAARAAPVAAAVMAPWWLRNALVFGAFVPLTSAGGVSLWIGNNPLATGNWLPPPVARPGTSELAYGAATAHLARAWIAGHPFAFVRLTAAKFVRALGVGEFGVERLSLFQPEPSPARIALWTLVAQASQLALLAGAAVSFARPRRLGAPLTLLIAACLVQLAGVGVWFEFGERHREFLTPFLLLALARVAGRQSQVAAA